MSDNDKQRQEYKVTMRDILRDVASGEMHATVYVAIGELRRVVIKSLGKDFAVVKEFGPTLLSALMEKIEYEEQGNEFCIPISLLIVELQEE